MQVDQAPEEVCGCPVQPACARRPVVILREPYVAQTGQDTFESDPGLDPGEGRADAGVNPAPERDVFAEVGAVDVESLGIVEASGVAVGGPGQEKQRGPRLQRDAAQAGRLGHEAVDALGRRLKSEDLLDEIGVAPAPTVAAPEGPGPRRGAGSPKRAAGLSSPGRQ